MAVPIAITFVGGRHSREAMASIASMTAPIPSTSLKVTRECQQRRRDRNLDRPRPILPDAGE